MRPSPKRGSKSSPAVVGHDALHANCFSKAIPSHSAFPDTHASSAGRSTEWQPFYFAALIESDEQLVLRMIQSAENAIFKRMKTIYYSHEHRQERVAIEDAWDALQQRKKQCLGRAGDAAA